MDSEADLSDLMNTIPYELERIPPEWIEEVFPQSGKTFQLALHFRLPKELTEKIRKKMGRLECWF